MIVEMGALVISIGLLIIFWRYYALAKLNKRLLENEERFEISHELSNSGIWEYNVNAGELYWSRMISKMFGGPEGELITSYESYVAAIHLDDREFVLASIDACIQNNEEYNVTYRVVWANGTIRWLAAWGYGICGSNGDVERMVGVVQDITERKQIEDDLLTQSQIVTHIEEGANLVRVKDQILVYTNPAFEQMFGYEEGELLGKHISVINAPSDVSPEDVANQIRNELEANGVWRGEVQHIKKDGTHFWSSPTVSTFDHPMHGKVWVSIHTDISERKLMLEKLSYQASHDSLTGLISRYEFEKRATSLLSAISKESGEHAMCFLDLDQFKVINDTCGHAAGDELLRQLGRVLGNTVRKRDTLARLGGDEFGVLIEHCTLEQGFGIASDILAAVLDHQFFWEGKTFRIGVSVGLVAITQTSGNFTDLLRQADAACYLAKDHGRNRIHTYHPDDNDLAARHGEMQWVGRLTQALDENRFCLYAQPIVSLDNDSHRHYEILVRMLGEDGGIIPPGAFLPAAERYSLIGRIDAWVVSNTFAFLAKNPIFTEQIDFVSVNLSGRSLTNEKFLEFIFDIFKQTGIPAKKVCFEITETAAVSNMASAISFVESLKEIGCQFALDDFGSGISSFGYLKNLPVDYLKIDGMFVKDIVKDPIDFAMVKSINEVGQVMGMKTIAEFVENDEIKMKLKTIGVDFGQGYGLGRPKPIEDLIV
jgi:diguanylate cyclase (GGDEF)-like protein/PAS domain S-box-containing protein